MNPVGGADAGDLLPGTEAVEELPRAMHALHLAVRHRQAAVLHLVPQTAACAAGKPAGGGRLHRLPAGKGEAANHPPAAAQPARTLPGGADAAHLRGAEPRGNRRTLRQTRLLGEDDLLPWPPAAEPFMEGADER